MARRSDHTREELRRMALDAGRAIIERNGLRELSTRRIASAIGYTPGTLYQLFEDLDDLIIQVNIETLDALYTACEIVDFDRDPEAVLMDLASNYLTFTGQHPKLWNALFEHALPEGRELPDQYNQRIIRLRGLGARALVPLLPGDDGSRAAHEARVLWSSLYGIVSLWSSNKMAKNETPEAIIHSLVTNYVAGLRLNQHSLRDFAGAESMGIA